MMRRVLAALLLMVLAAAGALLAKREAVALGAEAYLFGYPLVLMDLTRDNLARRFGVENQLVRVRIVPGPAFKDVVRPNADTLYATAFIDMDQGPWVFELPAIGQRYALMPFLDAWTNVLATPGTRTTGQRPARLLLAGPRWNGAAPEGMELLRAPTRMVWLIGRIQTDNAADYPLVHALQDGLGLRTLADWQAGRTPTPMTWDVQAATGTPSVEQLRQMDTPAFFARMAALMATNPPAPGDAPMLERLSRLGVVPGQPLHWRPVDRWAVALGRAVADWKVARALRDRPTVRGWMTPPNTLGRYGTDYQVRAVVAMLGLGANLPDDALYSTAAVDGEGRPLHGDHRYRLHFAKDGLPPVRAFWSVTAYGSDDFLIENPLHRYALGDRDPLVRNADGSLDLLVQADPPPDAMKANWLPVRRGEAFGLTARLYWPQPAALEGRWGMPAMERMD